jgi:GDPmannose 4,6-dehydratase
MKRALVTGVAGQDGTYLAELLVAKGCEVFGMTRDRSNLARVPGEVKCVPGDLADHQSIRAIVSVARPDEVYHLGGVTDLETAFSDPAATMRINYDSVRVLLDACVRINPNVRFLQASSSEVFLPSPAPLSECSPRDWETINPYAAAKMRADRDIIAEHRSKKAGFACSAFLFNHDSPRRSEKSALRKITRTFAAIRHGLATSLVIGNVELFRDWGYAREYVEAMWMMLQIDNPEDLVLASGVPSQVKDAVNIAAKYHGIELSWHGKGVDAFASDRSGRRIVTVAPDLYRPAEALPKVGDISKAGRVIGWRPATDFRSLVEMMAREDHQDLLQRREGYSLPPA